MSDFFYFCEQTSPDTSDIKNFSYTQKKVGDVWWLSFPADLIFFEVMNRNNRQYLGDNFMECVFSPKNKALMAHNGWFGEQDHPSAMLNGQELTKKRVLNVYMPNRSHKIINPVRRGNTLSATIETDASTEAGRGMAIAIVQGLIPSFSCRSTGEMQLYKGKPTVIVNRVITFDWVQYPGFDGADMKGSTAVKSKSVVTESSSDNDDELNIMIPFDELAGDVIEEDPETQQYMEAFEEDGGEIAGFTEKEIIIKKNGLYVYHGLNPQSVERVRDFYRSFNI